MSELGELLELLYGARGRFRSARGVVRYRHSNRLLMEAQRREHERLRRGGSGATVLSRYATVGGEEPPDLHEERIRFWWEPPDRLREETETSGGRGPRTVVIDGELWWTYTPESGAISNAELSGEERAQHHLGGGERFRSLLDPSALSAVLEVDSIDAVGDRLRVRARPRDDRSGPPLHLPLLLPAAAAEIELEVDRATGVVRRLAAFLDGEEITATELVELALDEDFAPETFVFVPPPGEEVLPPDSAGRRRPTLEEAAAEAPFVVFAPRELPEGMWRLHVHFRAARRRPASGAHVALVYHRADGRGAVIVSQQAAAGAGGIAWAGNGPPQVERLERGGVSFTVARGDVEQGGQNYVRFERDGTAIQVQSQELDVEALLEVAATLVRVEPS